MTGRRSTGRRSFLGALATAGALGLAGCAAEEEPPPEYPMPTPDDLPTTTGGSPTGTPTTTTGDGGLTEVAVDAAPGDEVSEIVAGVESGELLVFPSGRFRWESEALVTAAGWGIRAQDDTVFEVPAGVGDGEHFELIKTRDRERDRIADDYILKNLTVDSPGRAAPGLQLGARNTARVDGLHYLTDGPLTNGWQQNGIRAFVENPDGTIQIENYRQFNNGDLGAYGGGDSRIGIWVGPDHRGTIYLRNPVLQGFPNNGCYVSRTPGNVIVDGGLLMNNNVSAVRVSGGVKVYGSTIYIDVDRYLEGPGVIEAPAHNTRGVWGDNRQAGTDGGLVEGASFVLRSYRRCTGLATILENTNIKIDDCQFLLDTTIQGVRAFNGWIDVVDSDFDGASADSTAGVGFLRGAGNHVAANIEPGDVPVESREPAFRWSRTHPETPGRPRPGEEPAGTPAG